MSKVMSLAEAISRFVHDGDVVYAAGFTHLIPFAAGHEIIRQHKRDLTLARATPDLIYDQLVAAGCAKKLIFSYSGNPGVGSLRIIRQEMEAGRLDHARHRRRDGPAVFAHASDWRRRPGESQSAIPESAVPLHGR
jgi:glutaconate CoA-transferase subunit A